MKIPTTELICHYDKLPFQVGDTVAFYNDFSFNPANKVFSVGIITGIHFFYGHELFYSPQTEDSPLSLKGKITYNVSSSNVSLPVEKLTLIKRRS